MEKWFNWITLFNGFLQDPFYTLTASTITDLCFNVFSFLFLAFEPCSSSISCLLCLFDCLFLSLNCILTNNHQTLISFKRKTDWNLFLFLKLTFKNFYQFNYFNLAYSIYLFPLLIWLILSFDFRIYMSYVIYWMYIFKIILFIHLYTIYLCNFFHLFTHVNFVRYLLRLCITQKLSLLHKWECMLKNV